MTLSERNAAYTLLGLTPDADKMAVRSAWRALVRTYHPDLAKDNPVAAHKKLVEINAAFELISHLNPRDAKPKIQGARPVQPKTTAVAKPRPRPQQPRPVARKVEPKLTTSGQARATMGFSAMQTNPWTVDTRIAHFNAKRAFETAQAGAQSHTSAHTQKVYA